MDPKQRAAEAALELIASNMVVGLGTGSTADFFLVALAQAIKNGKLTNIRGIPTSNRSEQRSNELGIPLTTLAKDRPDVTVDGADDIAPNLDVIKGLGGAMLREKIVAQNSKKLVIIADQSKLVSVLGTKSPLPVEVIPFGYETQVEFLTSLGGVPALRKAIDGKPYVTDSGNLILDCKFRQIDDPRELERRLGERAGIVESGLFVGIAKLALVATEQGVKRIEAR